MYIIYSPAKSAKKKKEIVHDDPNTFLMPTSHASAAFFSLAIYNILDFFAVVLLFARKKVGFNI